MSKMLPKIKIDEDGRIKIDDDNKNGQEVKKQTATRPEVSSSNGSSKSLLLHEQNEDRPKSETETLPEVIGGSQESDPSITSNTTFTKAFSVADSSSYPDQNVNKSKHEKYSLACDKEVNWKSIPLVVVDDLQISSEFQQVLEAIKSRDASQLEEALINHRSVLHITTPDQRLIELSMKEALLSSNVRILDLVYEHWATAALTSPSDRIDTNFKNLTESMIAAKNSCLDVLKFKKKVLLAQHCLVAYNNFRIHLHQQLIACQVVSTTSDRMAEDAKKQRQNITTALNTYKTYRERIMELTSFDIIDEQLYKFLADDSNSEYRNFLIYNIFELYYRKLDLCISHIIIEYKRMFVVSGAPYTEVVRAVYYLLYRADEDIHLYTPDKKFKLKHVISNKDRLDFDDYLIDPKRLVMYLEQAEFKKAIKRFDPLHDSNTENKFLLAKTVEDDIETVHFLKIIVTYLKQCLRLIQRLPIKDCTLIIVHVLKTIKKMTLGDKLVYAHIPVSVFSQLEKLTDDIGKFRLKELEESRSDLCLEVSKEIDQIIQVLAEIINIRKPFIDQHLLNDHINLVSDRISELRHNNSRLKMLVKQLFYLDRDELLSILKDKNTHFNQLMSKYGLTLELLSENIMLVYNTKLLKRDLNNKIVICMKYTINNLQMYTDCVESVLKDIEENIDNKTFRHNKPYLLTSRGWMDICEFLSVVLTNFNWPDGVSLYLKDKNEINNVRNFLKSLVLETKNRAFLYNLKKSSHPDKQTTCEYRAIEELIKFLTKKVFLSISEIEYLKDNIDIPENEKSTLLPLFKQVLRGEEISTEERDMIQTNINMNDRCKTIISHLWEGVSREDFLLEYLIVRVAALKNVIAGNNLVQLVQRYKIDDSFSLLMEELLRDIDETVRNYVSYDHRCRLDCKHYESFEFECIRPHTEVRYVDTDILLVKNLRSALSLVEDELILIKLCKLQEDGFGREEVKRSWNGPNSYHLKDYFELLPQKGAVKLTYKSKKSGKINTENLMLASSKSSSSAVMCVASATAEAAVSAASTTTSSATATATAAQAATSAQSTPAAIAQAATTAAQLALTAVQAATTAAQAAEKVHAALASIIALANTPDADVQKL